MSHAGSGGSVGLSAGLAEGHVVFLRLPKVAEFSLPPPLPSPSPHLLRHPTHSHHPPYAPTLSLFMDFDMLVYDSFAFSDAKKMSSHDWLGDIIS